MGVSLPPSLVESIHRLLSTLLPNGPPKKSKKKGKKKSVQDDEKSAWEDHDPKEELEFKVFLLSIDQLEPFIIRPRNFLDWLSRMIRIELKK